MARTPTAEDAQRERTQAVASTRRRTLRWQVLDQWRAQTQPAYTWD